MNEAAGREMTVAEYFDQQYNIKWVAAAQQVVVQLQAPCRRMVPLLPVRVTRLLHSSCASESLLATGLASAPPPVPQADQPHHALHCRR